MMFHERCPLLQVSAQRPRLMAASHSGGGGSGSITISRGSSGSGNTTSDTSEANAAADGLRLAFKVADIAADAATGFRLHRYYSVGAVLSKTNAAVRGFALAGTEVKLSAPHLILHLKFARVQPSACGSWSQSETRWWTHGISFAG